MKQLYAKKNYFPYLLITLIISIVYSCTLRNGFSFDDGYITENPNVLQGIDGLNAIWHSPFITTYTGLEVDFRPIPLSLYAIEYQFFGANPAIHHFISLLFYIINVCLLYVVCLRVFEIDKIHPYLPIMIVLLYAVHPSHVEVVASLKNRDEILSFSFILIASLFLVKSLKVSQFGKSVMYVFLTGAFFYLSILSKLVSLPFLPCMFLWTIYKGYYKNKTVFILLIVILLIVLIIHFYINVDYYASRIETNFYEKPITSDTPLLLRLGLGFNSVLYYLKFLIIPFPFRYYYGYNVIPFETLNQPLPSIALLISLALVALVIISIVKKKMYSYFLFCTLGFLLFYSNLIFTYTGVVSERAMYQMSFFFIAFVLIFLYNYFSAKKNFETLSTHFIKIYALVILIYGGLSFSRSLDWKSTLSLVVGDMKYLKESELANYMTGFNLYSESLALQETDNAKSQEYAKMAEFYFKEAINLAPEWDRNYFQLGETYKYLLNNDALAEENYKIALTKDKTITENVNRELASLLFIQNKFKEAIPYYDAAVQQTKDDKELDFYRVLNLLNAHEINRFLDENNKLEEKYPDKEYAYLNYGNYYMSTNQIVLAVQNFEKAVQLGNQNPQVIEFIYQYYLKQNNHEKIQYFERLHKAYSN